MSEEVEKAKALGEGLKRLRVSELAIRQERLHLREEWAKLYKTLTGSVRRDAVDAYWEAQRDEEIGCG